MANEMTLTQENELFVKAAADNMDGLRSRTQEFIRIRIYDQKGIARTILDATPITFEELEKDINNAAYMIVDLEGNRQRAMTVPFTAQEVTTYEDMPQVKFPLEEIDSEEIVKNMTEIKFLKHSFADEMENACRMGILHREDNAFITACNASAALAGQAMNITAKVGQNYFYKEDFVTLQKVFPSAVNPLRANLFLMNEATWLDIQNWNHHEFDSEAAKKVMVEGLDFNTLLGIKVQTTIKNDLVADNTCFAFAAPEHLGVMRILQDVTLFMEKEKKEIKYWFTEQIIMGIANVNAVAKMTLV